MSSDKSKGKSGRYYHYYLCKHHRKNLSSVKLHKIFDEILTTISLPPELIADITERLKSKIDESINNRGGDLMRAKMSLSKVQDKIAATQERFLLQPDISEKVYSKVIAGLKADEQRLQTQIAELNSNSRNYYSIMDELLPMLSDVKALFHSMPVLKKLSFIRLIFGETMSFEDGTFRTPYINPLFSHNALTLKEKRLLLVEQPESILGITPTRRENGNWLELLKEMAALVA